MDFFRNAHFIPLASQGNVYTFKDLKLANGSNCLLGASLKREVFCYEYQLAADDSLTPLVTDVSFTYIPSGAEIIAIDAFNKSESKNDFVIGITIIKSSADLKTLEAYLNIYSEWEESDEFNIKSIAENCLSIELNFIPYHLTHTFLVLWKDDFGLTKEIVFLSSGSDSQIHMFRENKTNHSYKEYDCKEFFPEFLKPPSIVLWIDVCYYDNFKERLSAFGCECGYLRLCRIESKTNKIIFNFSTRFQSSITYVQFQIENKVAKKPALLQYKKKTREEMINMVIVNSILPAVFFKDVKIYGLKKYGSLRRCEFTSISTCQAFGDIDGDGKEEIIVGNSSKELFLYKCIPVKGWILHDQKDMASPVFGVKWIDITGDGVKELVVFSMKGLYIFQHDSKFVQMRLEAKCDKIYETYLKKTKSKN